MIPFGSAQTPGFFPAGRIAAIIQRPFSRRTSTLPAENSLRTAGFYQTRLQGLDSNRYHALALKHRECQVLSQSHG